MNTANLFDYCSNEITTIHKTIYFIGNVIGNTLLTIAIDNTDHKIYSYSNEWLYLIKDYYNQGNPFYNELVKCCNNIIKQKCIDFSYAAYDVIPFITSFSRGTVHGYSGLFCVLNEYINNLDTYKNYKIIVYKDSQSGLLDIINHFVNKNIINKENIIYISSCVQYLFNSIKFIPNKWHLYPRHHADMDFLLERYIVKKNKPLLRRNDKICIVKSSISDNRTNDGIISAKTITTFCNKNNLLSLEPTQMSEIVLINKINRSRIFVTSWGTAFFKNYIYISNKCEKIIVLVIGDAFIKQYHNDKNVQTTYKNAIIKYYIVNTNLDVDINKL